MVAGSPVSHRVSFSPFDVGGPLAPRFWTVSRTAEGKSKREIIRCLKRFVAREIFGYLCRVPKPTRPEQISA